MAQVGTPQAAGAPYMTPDVMMDLTQRRFRGSGKISDYEIEKERLGEGTFGVVSKARSRRTGQMVALKKILMHNEKDGFPITALREVKLLKMLSHTNIVRLEEMAVERLQSDEKSKAGKKRATLYMVTPYMDHDLSGMLTNPDIKFSEAQIKCYMLQLLEGLRYLHDSHILHRDMKAANILISNKGILQIADFGLARHYEGVTPQPGHGNGDAVRDYTSLVVTRWYRPPELLLALKRYTPAIDMWGVGCVFAEMFEQRPILEGNTDINQCERIFKLLGPPTEQTMPGWFDLPGCEGRRDWDNTKPDVDKRFGRIGPQGLHLLKRMLCLDWHKRINAIDALQHEYFTTAPLPARPEDLPRYEDSHELDARRRGRQEKQQRAALPPAPAGGTVGMGPDEWIGQPYQNGYSFNDRPRYNSRERVPPYRGHDDPGRRGVLRDFGGSRQPAWQQDRDRSAASRSSGPPIHGGHPLPARPVDALSRPDASGTRGAPPSSAAGALRPNVDTYIPSYQTGGVDARPPRDGYGLRNSREGSYRDPDAVSRDGGRYRDDARYHDSYHDRDRDHDRDRERDRDRDRGSFPPRDRGEPRRTRSRSPDRERRDERRERLQNREREMYRH